jgi:mannose-6-phosphate isomerase-like protein (cupin superfamily)
MNKVNIAEKFGLFSERWSPKLVGQLDDYEIKLVRIEGDFLWHSHEKEDELFLVVEGSFRMDFRDRSVEVHAGEFLVVPKRVEHKPFAQRECKIMLFERKGVPNTGQHVTERTVAEPERI